MSGHGRHRPADPLAITVATVDAMSGGRAATLAEAGADTVYFHLYDVADLEHVGLLGREVLPRLD